MTPTRKALFLDRDGVVNEEVGYLHRPADVRFLPGLVPCLQAAQALGYLLVIVTNQAGIARGLYTEADFHALMSFMRAELARDRITLDAIYFSPHLDPGHPDRKPNPGMLRRAAQDLALDLAQSVMVGDRCSDIAAATAAGLRHAFLLAGTEARPCPDPHTTLASLAELEAWLREHTPTAAPPPQSPAPPDPSR